MEEHPDEISKEKMVITHSGSRAAIAYCLFRKNGFKPVRNFSAEMKERLLQKGKI